MAQRSGPFAGRVAVVTGGGGGIGTAAALELARQGAVVVAMDPGDGVQGEPLGEPTAARTAERIEAAGGKARASTVSVTDAHAVATLFRKVVDELGSLDVVVNTAGVLRSGALPDASEDDWSTVLDVHLDGYLNVLAAALPIMEEAGYGRVVGFTSGVGQARTSAQSPAYGSAKRAVAALTRHLGPAAPPGVAINALSPIAATRMVRGALVASGSGGAGTGPAGLDLSAMPQPEAMAPATAYLAGEQLEWCRGQVLFSAGSELSPIGRPALLEAVRTSAGDFAGALGTLVPVVLGPAASLQATTGGSNPRFGAVFDVTPGGSTPSPGGSTASEPGGPGCLVVADDGDTAQELAAALARWGRRAVGVGPWGPFDPRASQVPVGFAEAGATLDRAEHAAGPVDAVVVALDHETPAPAGSVTWRELVEGHRHVAHSILAHAAWSRAAARHALATGRPVRVVHVVAARTPGGKTAAEAVTQLARSSNDSPLAVAFDTFCVGLESGRREDLAPLGHLSARLACADDVRELAGAELAVLPGWVALRRHPGPVATVSFGGPEIPPWVTQSLREATGT